MYLFSKICNFPPNLIEDVLCGIVIEMALPHRSKSVSCKYINDLESKNLRILRHCLYSVPAASDARSLCYQGQHVGDHYYRIVILCFVGFTQGKADYSEYKKQMDASLVIFGYLLNIVCLSGIIGNILSYVIMRSKEFKDSTTGIYLQVVIVNL